MLVAIAMTPVDAERGDSYHGPALVRRQRRALLWELQRRGPCTQRVLADALNVAPRTITTLIDALVETGFVTREPHPSDRRATLVTFTPHGQETARALVEGHRQLARTLFEDLPVEVLDGFDTRLVHVVARLRILTTPTADNR